MKNTHTVISILFALGIHAHSLTLSDSTVTLNFHDQPPIQGKVQFMDSSEIVVRLRNSDSTQNPSQQNTVMSPTAQATEPENKSGRSRYLYAPSSYNLAQGECQFSQKELLFSTFNFGVTDNISLQIGSILPALFVSGGQNALASIKVGKMWDNVGLHAGIQGFFFKAASVALPFVGGTLGNQTSQVTVNIATSLNSESSTNHGQVINISAATRVSPRLSLITEDYLVADGSDSYFMGSAALRFHANKIDVDTGFFFMEYVSFPVPWLDFSVDF